MSKRSLELKQRLRGGGIVYGAWLTFASAGVAEVLAGSGLDVLLIDTEHTSIGLDALEAVLGAIARWDTPAIVRVPGNDAPLIKRILDIGADGIIVPMVMDADQARAAVGACKYPLAGFRGFGPRRASDYFRDLQSYVATANEATFVLPQVEHVAAVEHAEAIAAVEGIDALCLGPMDLSLSCGLLGQLEHPRVAAALDRIFAAAAGRRLPVCLGMAVPPEEQPRWVAKGARFVIASDDLLALRTGVADHLAAARRLLEPRAGEAATAAGAPAPTARGAR